MRLGSTKYRKIQASLDEAGITTNILRIGPGRYELHLNYQIVKTSKTRRTCNRHLIKLQNIPTPMEFFKKLSELAPNTPLSMRIQPSEDGKITVSVLPDNLKNIQPLLLVGTADELDEGFFGAITKPMAVVSGLTTNAEAFTKEAEEALKKTPSTPSAKTPAPAAKKTEEKKPLPKLTPKAKPEEAAKPEPKKEEPNNRLPVDDEQPEVSDVRKTEENVQESAENVPETTESVVKPAESVTDSQEDENLDEGKKTLMQQISEAANITALTAISHDNPEAFDKYKQLRDAYDARMQELRDAISARSAEIPAPLPSVPPPAPPRPPMPPAPPAPKPMAA